MEVLTLRQRCVLRDPQTSPTGSTNSANLARGIEYERMACAPPGLISALKRGQLTGLIEFNTKGCSTITAISDHAQHGFEARRAKCVDQKGQTANFAMVGA